MIGVNEPGAHVVVNVWLHKQSIATVRKLTEAFMTEFPKSVILFDQGSEDHNPESPIKNGKSAYFSKSMINWRAMFDEYKAPIDINLN